MANIVKTIYVFIYMAILMILFIMHKTTISILVDNNNNYNNNNYNNNNNNNNQMNTIVCIFNTHNRVINI